LDVKRCLAIFALTVLAQTAKEQALGEHLLRQATLFNNTEVAAYVERTGAQLAAGYRFAVVVSDEPQPYALPANIILVPVQALANAASEAAFARSLAHAIGHSALRHGHVQAQIPLYVSITHAERRWLPSVAGRWSDLEAAADRYAESLLQSAPFREDSEAFLRLRRALQGPVRRVPSLQNP
jgi:hypothetical protein